MLPCQRLAMDASTDFSRTHMHILRVPACVCARLPRSSRECQSRVVFVFDDELRFQGLKSAQSEPLFQPSLFNPAPARLNHICTLNSYASGLGTKTGGK